MGDSSVATSGTKKKKGFFKSIGKGKSFKKKKNRPDDDSVVGVALDRNSNGAGTALTPATGGGGAPRSVPTRPSPPPAAVGGGGSSSSTAAKPIQVVLLLMDPSSRRFELLQLEFDSNKAMVSDVLRQIQASATEKTLRDTTYAGVCDQTGMEMISSMKLSKFCKGNDVVMAMPKGMSGKDTAKLAGPILGDPKVEDMLAPCGVKIQPIAKKSRSSSGNTKLTKIAEEDVRRKDDKKKRPLSPKKASESSEKKKKSSSSLPTIVLGLIISSLVFFTAQRHVRVTNKLESGDVLMPGEWKSQCGIFDLVPPEWLDKLPLSSSCDPAVSPMLEYGRDGTLRYFTKSGADGDRKEIWSMAGSGECSEGEEEECSDEGATFVKDGSTWYVDMGGIRSSLNKDVVRDFVTES